MLTVQANDERELVESTNENLDRIHEWISENDLQLDTHKTEAIILRGPKKKDHIKLKLGDSVIGPKKTIKYLGVHLNSMGTFGPHIRETAKKADRKTSALAKLLPNVQGPRAEKRAVVHNILLYAASIWKEVMRIAKYKGMFIWAQRQALLRVASAYRTVSSEAVQVIQVPFQST